MGELMILSPRHFATGLLAAGLLFLPIEAGLNGQQNVRLPAEDRILTGQPEEIFAAGKADGASWELFSSIRGLAFDASGNLYVLDAGNHRVVVLDPDGRFQRQFGKRGQGPGEFRNPFHIALTSQTEVVVLDVSNRALVIFGGTGEFLRQVSLAELTDGPRSVYAAQEGRILALSGGRESSEGRFARVYVLPARTGETPAELAREPLPGMLRMRLRSSETGIANLRRTPIYSPEAYLAVTPDGTVILQSDAPYAVKIFDRSGHHVRTLTRDLPLKRVTKAIRDVYVTSWSRSRVESGASAELPYDPPFAETMSQITGLRADHAGRVWVRRRADNGDEHGPIDIVTPAGEYRGTLRDQSLPDAFGPDGRMAFISRDAPGVERVIVRRQPRAWQ